MKKSIKILIVDDEAITAKAIKGEVEKMGYGTVGIATTYNKAMSHIKKETPDLILLDINLKGKQSGIDLANEKIVLNKIPIIYITGYSKHQVIEELLATNLISRLSKPLRYDELEITIALALNHKKGVIELGYDFTYDLENKHLFMENIAIRLSPNEKRLLERLIAQKGEFVPMEVLKFEIWGNEAKAEASLRTLVWNLNKKFKCKKCLKRVENVPFFGYKLKLSEGK
jgi:DNA-binding response OmpR family regulator